MGLFSSCDCVTLKEILKRADALIYRSLVPTWPCDTFGNTEAMETIFTTTAPQAVFSLIERVIEKELASIS
jgi:hypothetical protein